jgi:hypothetical protein
MKDCVLGNQSKIQEFSFILLFSLAFLMYVIWAPFIGYWWIFSCLLTYQQMMQEGIFTRSRV